MNGSTGAVAPGGAAAVVPASTYDVALLDLDGVVYRGGDAVPHAAGALAEARARGMALAFVTNNAARTPHMVAEHLRELGVRADAQDVVTSAQAAARLVAERVPAGSPVLVVGGEGLRVALRERGLVPVGSADDEPVAVVQGFAPDVDWRLLAEGAYALARGLPWIASNTDLTVPTARGIAPGNGTLVQVLRTATGARPEVAGKPELPMHRESIRRTGARRPLVVGDRLDTDIEGAVRGGVDSLLVLTGVTGADELLAAPPHRRPTWIAADLRALLVPLIRPVAAARVEDGAEHRAEDESGVAVMCGSWRARVVRGTLRLDATSDDGDRLDALRAACAAVWAHDGTVATTAARAVLGRWMDL